QIAPACRDANSPSSPPRPFVTRSTRSAVRGGGAADRQFVSCTGSTMKLLVRTQPNSAPTALTTEPNTRLENRLLGWNHACSARCEGSLMPPAWPASMTARVPSGLPYDTRCCECPPPAVVRQRLTDANDPLPASSWLITSISGGSARM